ncbi:hypothetical protein BU16DRAFT_532497 [Lophium mytilinum]|uniref:Uncharacterized protein n=1 Tax=Lophium mytilinum TaxID=390894 RepID=A0A6A6RED2_9PEZI|nr:hypothetical protein BU16DRAFT_532497 [Lophium mytilinum]
MGQNNSITTASASAAAAALSTPSPGPVTAAPSLQGPVTALPPGPATAAPPPPPRVIARLLLRPTKGAGRGLSLAYAFGDGFTALDAETKKTVDRTNAEGRAWAMAAALNVRKWEVLEAKQETERWLKYGDEAQVYVEMWEDQERARMKREAIDRHWPANRGGSSRR